MVYSVQCRVRSLHGGLVAFVFRVCVKAVLYIQVPGCSLVVDCLPSVCDPPGLNAQARRLTQRGRARVTSLFLEGSGAPDQGLWRSMSEMDLLSAGHAPQTPLSEDPEVEADKEVQRRLGVEKEETESSDDCSTQFSVHPPFDFPYFLLLQGYSHKQVSQQPITCAQMLHYSLSLVGPTSSLRVH